MNTARIICSRMSMCAGIETGTIGKYVRRHYEWDAGKA